MENVSSGTRFVCQRCWLHLQLDSAFLNCLDDHTIAELSLPAVRTPDLDLSSHSLNLDNYVPSRQEQSSANQGFTVVNHTFLPNLAPNFGHISHYLWKSVQLFDLVSSTSDVDHPLCHECADSLISLLEQHLALAEEEWTEYKHFLMKIAQVPEEAVLSGLEGHKRDLAAFQTEEEQLICELKELTYNLQVVSREIEEEKTGTEILEHEEEMYWRQHSLHYNHCYKVIDEQASLECQLQFIELNLDRLKLTNSFNSGDFVKIKYIS